jgi:HK97 gp10 family phage protein
MGSETQLRSDMGSNLAEQLTWGGIQEVTGALERFVRAMGQSVIREALTAGAKVLQDALQAATPVGSASYTYTYNGRTMTVKNKRAVGQAKANVIRYERKMVKGLYGYYTQEQALAKGLISEAELPVPSLLIGYEKRNAYYMYWYEYGTKNRQMTSVSSQYITKTGKWSKGKKKFVYEKGSSVKQAAKPFIRATFDANINAAFQAAAEVCRSKMQGAING